MSESYELIIFDMDGTLYTFGEESGEQGLFASDFYKEVERRGESFLQKKLSLPKGEASRVRQDIFKQYNGDMSLGLEQEYGIDRYAYFGEVWAIDPCPYVKEDERLKAMLERIPQRKAVLSNAPRAWLSGVLRQLGIQDFFEYIWTGESDIRKPCNEAYLQVTRTLNIPPEQCLMVEDSLEYLLPAAKLGMGTVLIGKQSVEMDTCLDNIYQLEDFLEMITNE